MSDNASSSGAGFSCPRCSKTYKRREHLQRHAASHSSLRPHRCSFCGQSYQRADVLKRHALACQTKVRTGEVSATASSSRRACDLCVQQKKACSTGQPCEHCRRKSVQCIYSFSNGVVTESNLLVGQDEKQYDDETNLPTVVFGDDTLFDYLGNYTSVSDMLQGSDNNQDWLDFINLAAGHFQIIPTSPQTHLDNYTFHFLDNFTRRSGLVGSFDCGTFEQRVQVEASHRPGEGQGCLTTELDELVHLNGSSRDLPRPQPLDLHDPLIIQTHQILLDIKEVVTVKPRNSVVELEWSTVLEQTCIQFFSPHNLRKYLSLFWHIWHPNVNFVHRPTFDPVTSKSILVACMALIGASVSPSKTDNEQAKIWFNCVEEIVFTDDDFCNDPLNNQDTLLLNPVQNISKIQALQAAYMVCLYQGWEGTEANKRRIRRYRFSTVISMARDFGIMSARHPDYSTCLYDRFDWRDFAAREQLIRIFLWIYLLDHAFVIFNNLPPRMVIKEMSMHMAFPEAAFQASTSTECARELQNWHLRSTPLRNITFREVVESFCGRSFSNDMRRLFADLGPLNLFAVVSAFHALIFQHQNSFGGHDQLQAVRNALDNWKSAWETYSDEFSFSPPHVMVDRHNVATENLWRRVGFMRHSPEYWLLGKLLVDRLSSDSFGSPESTVPDASGSAHEPILTRYDQTSKLSIRTFSPSQNYFIASTTVPSISLYYLRKTSNPQAQNPVTLPSFSLIAPALDGSFELSEVYLDSLQPDEALIEIHASGVCHTDLSCASGKLPCAPNAVLGHEGGGVVLEIGANVTSVSPGDKVLLSFSSCGSCPGCKSDHPAYCYSFNDYNFGGKRPDGSAAMSIMKDGTKQPIYSTFFGQSSFAARTIVHQSSIVKVPQQTPLDLFAPLGCGIQTGVGAVFNTLNVRPGTSIAIFGVGSVGLAAVMAAKARETSRIIAIDLQPERLGLAKELGATDGVLGPDQEYIIKAIKNICPPLGVDFAVDCTGVPSIIETMVAALGMRGRAATVGAPGGNAHAKIDIMSHLTYGKEYVGCSEGDSNPGVLIPELIEMHAKGLLPLEKLIAYYDIKDYEKAMADMKSGKVIKPVLKWTG
ncbi:Aryl-alcohol dehydrogenase [Fusarium oxysporum f. sp. raphani]|uniref:Aryl-alcohol dehydrogenase n=1 Tax=Fusarium oxysporum f. sp. raphani TaxID=96318 RepID=A0A8J5PL11_FUSOX|nr:Aryl-alcohol dehydrogenase [Fusarium oxysporum f. sp. raphani]